MTNQDEGSNTKDGIWFSRSINVLRGIILLYMMMFLDKLVTIMLFI